MKRIFSLLVVVLSLFVASSASAECVTGDVEMGPNCIHEEVRPGRDPMTSVYRVEGETVTHVWAGVGTVLASTSALLVIRELVSDPNGDLHLEAIRHNWLGSVYER